MKPRFVAALGWMVVSLPQLAHAYCRTTTCDPTVSCAQEPEQCCIWDAQGCDKNGKEISWRNSCVSYSIYELDSEDRGITADTLSEVVDDAFGEWLDTNCGGGIQPSLSFENYGPSSCGEPTFNQGSRDANANVWMFRDGTWPHAGPGQDIDTIDASALALTTVTFNWKTGEILDADVELNTAQANFTVGDQDVDVDLESIIQHESGHFLGLDHSANFYATMASGYGPGTVHPRQLSDDDKAGICAVYPKDREVAGESCQAYGVYSTVCTNGGCSLTAGLAPRDARLTWWALALSLLGAGALRRRRSASSDTQRPAAEG